MLAAQAWPPWSTQTEKEANEQIEKEEIEGGMEKKTLEMACWLQWQGLRDVSKQKEKEEKGGTVENEVCLCFGWLLNAPEMC